MKNNIKYFLQITSLALLLLFGLGQLLNAQSTTQDFSSPKYSKSIHEIEVHSEGKVTRRIIEEVFIGDYFPTLLDETITLTPPVLVVPYNASSGNSVTIKLSDSLATDENISLSASNDWVSTSPINLIPKNDTNTSYSFTVSVNTNPGFIARWTKIDITAKIGVNSEEVTATLYILQNPNPNPEVMMIVTPSYQIIENSVTTKTYTILTSIAPDDINSNSDISDDFTIILDYGSASSGWVINSSVVKNSNNEYTLTLTTNTNSHDSARLVSIVAKAKFGGIEKSSDPVLLLQKADNLDPFIFVSPAHQITEFDDTQVTYSILTSGLPNSDNSDEVTIADFIPNFVSGDNTFWNSFAFSVTPISTNEYSYKVDFNTNSTDYARYVDFTLQTKINGVEVTSEETILVQKSENTAAFLLASPREKQVSHGGDENLSFDIQRVNITEWKVATIIYAEQGDDWITWNDANGYDILSLKIESNTGLNTRSGKVVIEGKEPYSFITDTVSIYQYSGLDSYLMASPREISVDQDTNTVYFNVLDVNVEVGWEVVTPFEPWILSADRVDDTILKIKVDTNSLNKTRGDTIKIRGLGNYSSVEDVVKIYQYSALDTILLASPREKRVFYFGDTDVTFHHKKVNCADWDVDLSTLPEGDNPWITLNDSTHPDTVSFTVHPNQGLSTRSKTIYFRVPGHDSTVFDSVSIYQYSRPDLFLLASPREQKVAHFGNTNVEFNMKRVNIPNWELVPGTLPVGQDGVEWIQKNDALSTNDKMVLNVLPNDVDTTRYDTIFVRATTNDTVIDTVAIYQYSALQSYLLIAPRERKVDHHENLIEFEVTVVNIDGGWKVDRIEAEDWAEDQTEGDEDILKIRVFENTDKTTHQIKVVIRGKSPAYQHIKDSVMIYQSAREEKYLLISPRVDTVGYKGNQLIFDVDTVNVGLEKWVIDPTTPGLNDWVIDNGSNSFDLLSLNIKQNTADSTRQTTLRIKLENAPAVYDSVLIFQHSVASSYILTAPREQVVPWDYTDSLPGAFEIEAVNTNALNWKFTDVIDTSWLTSPEISNNELLFSIKNKNNTLSVRKAKIEIYDTEDASVFDRVTIYQETTFKPFIIPLPPSGDTLPKEITYSGDSFQINTYSNLDSYTASIPLIDTNWLHLSLPTDKTFLSDSLELTMNDSIWVTLDSNTISYPRASTITFNGNGITEKFYLLLEEGIRDTVPIEGFINAGEGIEPTDTIIIGAGVFSDTLFNGEQNYTVYVNKGWQGTVRPESKRYYFEPTELLYDTVKGGITDTLKCPNLTAYKIDPKVKFLTNEFEICFNDTLKLISPNIDYSYPEAKVTGTYGPIKYQWKLIGGDSQSISDTSALSPEFAPKWNSTYKLVISNSGFKDSATFTIIVNALPAAVEIFNPETVVCNNQGGVVYQAGEMSDTVFVSWSLPLGGGSFIGDTNTNIAVINWGNDPLITESELFLFTTDINGCESREPVVENIVINHSQDARVPTSVSLKGENYLICGDGNAYAYQWGWYEIENGRIIDHFIIPNQIDWYCQLPEGHIFDPDRFKYFVITYNDASSCGTRSFYSIPLGIDEYEGEGLKIYPNPTNNIIHIEFNNQEIVNNCKLRIYDFSGNLVYSEKKYELKNKNTLVLNGNGILSSGLYFIHIEVENKFYSAKIVVK